MKFESQFHLEGGRAVFALVPNSEQPQPQPALNFPSLSDNSDNFNNPSLIGLSNSCRYSRAELLNSVRTGVNSGSDLWKQRYKMRIFLFLKSVFNTTS